MLQLIVLKTIQCHPLHPMDSFTVTSRPESCTWRDSNSHALRHLILSQACLPEFQHRCNILMSLFFVVGAGIEPALQKRNWFLRPARLPVPPSDHAVFSGSKDFNHFYISNILSRRAIRIFSGTATALHVTTQGYTS